ncbi:hypothetical protein llap_7568 [Limosa lapponica baueri]|uniref:Uncharacterized protein n=1 Tax=Limosa lapponica baueri TaxID=1758121 RepID=A0A2I0U817_LIMLA|nr:hypothetical protein llap_7568 [Limosa lapponica baueri]
MRLVSLGQSALRWLESPSPQYVFCASVCSSVQDGDLLNETEASNLLQQAVNKCVTWRILLTPQVPFAEQGGYGHATNDQTKPTHLGEDVKTVLPKAEFTFYNILHQKAAAYSRTSPLLNEDSVSKPTPIEIAKSQEVIQSFPNLVFSYEIKLQEMIQFRIILFRLAEAKNPLVSYNNVDCYSDGKCKYLSVPDKLDQKCKLF